MRTKKIVFSLISAILAFSVICSSALTTFAVTQADLDRQKKKKDAAKSSLDSVRSEIVKINNIIISYNAKINTINSKISINKAEIKKQENEIAADKIEFQKRIRSIYMSGSDSSVRILLGAESFLQFLELSQLTSSVSSHDRKLIDDLKAKIDELNKKNVENEELLKQQVAAKEEVQKQQASLKTKEAAAQKLYTTENNNYTSLQNQKKAEDAAILARARGGGGSAKTPSFVNDSGAFLWPVAGFYTISAGYQSNDSVHRGTHNGIDISGGGISGAPIRSISDGYVDYVNNSCSHNYKKSGSCGCGGGYGNYCIINHGTVNGVAYSAYYAHAAAIIVSPGQKVSRGQVIGYVGTTGWSTGYHLHLGILKNGGWTNPANLSFAK